MTEQNTSPPKEDPSNAESTPTLMTLPAELRIQIYKYALIEDSDIDITSSFQQPVLLTVNQTIRREARQIWYKGNTFVITTIDYDASILERFAHKFLPATSPRRCRMKVQVHFSGEPHWANLMAWCRAVHARDFCLRGGGDETDDHEFDQNIHVTVAALRLSRSMGRDEEAQRLAWKAFRKVAGLVDPQWLEEK